MGLEIAELLMDVEDAFGITIADDDLPGGTVGEWEDYIAEQLRKNENRRCYSGFCFLRLRRAILQTADLERRRLRPSTPIREIVSEKEEKRFFLRAHAELGDLRKALPKYDGSLHVSSAWPARILFAILAVVTAASLLFAWLPFALALLLMALAAINIEYHSHNNPGSLFRQARFPRECRTLGDVAAYMASRLEPKDMGGAVPQPTEIAKIFRRKVADYAVLSPDEINRSNHLVKDLGLG